MTARQVLLFLEARGYAQAQGATSTANWIRHTLTVEPGTAKKTATMATAATGPHAAVGDALASGAVDWDQAVAIVKSLEVLPDSLSGEDLDVAREVMLEAASVHDAADLRALGRAIRHRRLKRAKPEGEERVLWLPSRLKPVDERSEEHHKGWECRLGEDGHPELIPPPWIDSERKPRRNHYWRLKRELLHPPDPDQRE